MYKESVRGVCTSDKVKGDIFINLQAELLLSEHTDTNTI